MSESASACASDQDDASEEPTDDDEIPEQNEHLVPWHMDDGRDRHAEKWGLYE